MATLTQNKPRPAELGDEVYLPMQNEKIFEGAYLGWSSGYVRKLQSGDKFAGISLEKRDNSAGAAGDLNLKSAIYGRRILPVTGAAAGDEGQVVYFTDDDTATLNAETGSPGGVVERVVSSGNAVVDLTPHNVELALLAQGVPASITFTPGAEAANAIVVAVQLKDANGNDLGRRAGLWFYLSSDANGDALQAHSATLTIAGGTDGMVSLNAAANALGHGKFFAVSEADGDIDISITETAGAATYYLIGVLPNGKLVPSGAITFAA